MEALVTLIDGSASGSCKMMVYEKTLNLSAFMGAWKTDFLNRSLQQEFISSVRYIYKTVYMDRQFHAYCAHANQRTTCSALKAAAQGILVHAMKLQRCWATQLSRPLPWNHSQDFRRNLSQAFGQLLFSQSFLIFNFTVTH